MLQEKPMEKQREEMMIKVKLIENIEVANPISWLLLEPFRSFTRLFGLQMYVRTFAIVCPFKAGCYYRITNTF